MFKTIKNFLYDMFSDNGLISSKRVAGFVCLIYIGVILVSNLFLGKIVDSELLYVIAGILATCFGLNTILGVKSMQTKNEVASGIVKEQPSQEIVEDAKDVLNSDKP